MKKLTKEVLREKLRKVWRFLANPHLLISVGIAWFITNGWAYCAAGIGLYADIPWLASAGTVWLAILWAPGTPEKLLTFAIAIGLLRLLFPDDVRTLASLRRGNKRLKERVRLDYARFRAKLHKKQPKEPEEHISGEQH